MSEYRTSVFSNRVESTYVPEPEKNSVSFEPLKRSRSIKILLVLIVASLAINIIFFHSPFQPPAKKIVVRPP